MQIGVRRTWRFWVTRVGVVVLAMGLVIAGCVRYGEYVAAAASELERSGMENLGQRDFVVAEARFREAQEKLGQLPWGGNIDTSKYAFLLGVALELQGKSAMADAEYRRAHAIGENVSQGAQHLITLGAGSEARSLEQNESPAAAETIHRAILDFHDKVTPSGSPPATWPMVNFAHLLRRRERFDEAEDLYRRAAAIQEKKTEKGEVAYAAQIQYFLADVLLRRDEPKEAQIHYQRALEILEKVYGRGHEETLEVLVMSGIVAVRQSRHAQAEPLFRRAHAIQEKRRGADHVDTAHVMEYIADSLRGQERYVEAQEIYRRTLVVFQKHDLKMRVAQTHANLASVAAELGDMRAAQRLAEHALALYAAAYGSESAELLYPLRVLASAWIEQGNARAARPVVERALAILQKSGNRVRKIDSAAIVEALASLFILEGRRREGKEQLLNALRIREETLGPEHRLTAKTREALANLN